MTTSATETATRAATLRQVAEGVPWPQVQHLARLALAEGHTADGTCGLVIEQLVATGDVQDSPQLRALLAVRIGAIAAARRPQIRAVRPRPVATTSAAVVVSPSPEEQALQGLPDELVEVLPDNP